MANYSVEQLIDSLSPGLILRTFEMQTNSGGDYTHQLVCEVNNALTEPQLEAINTNITLNSHSVYSSRDTYTLYGEQYYYISSNLMDHNLTINLHTDIPAGE